MKLDELEKKLPKICASRLPSNGDPIFIKFGETGYYPADGYVPEEFNAECGITPAQVEAMMTGSVFGWHAAGANPDVYIVKDGKVVGVDHAILAASR